MITCDDYRDYHDCDDDDFCVLITYDDYHDYHDYDYDDHDICVLIVFLQVKPDPNQQG